MSVSDLVSLGLVLLFLAAALWVFSKNTDKYVLPIVLVAAGVFLGGAQRVSASFAGIVDVEFADQVTDANTAVSAALSANEEAISGLSQAFDASQTAFEDYRKDVDARFRRLGTSSPVYRPPQQLKEVTTRLQFQLKRVEDANKAAFNQSQALKQLTQKDQQEQ